MMKEQPIGLSAAEERKMESRNDYTAVNSKTWDVWAEHGCEWSVPITHEDFVQAKAGNWGVFLTPCKTVPKDWFLPFPGMKILGLASGGGQQMPIFAALGADVTVFDNSDCQLSAERMVASRENYGIRVVKGDMTRPLPFSDGSFDLIFHPVSNCYVQEVLPIWRECFRVLRPGGRMIYVVPGAEHLYQMKAVLYEKPYKNPVQQVEYPGFRAIDEREVQGTITVPAAQLEALFAMTPYYWKTPRDGAARLAALPQLTTTIAFRFLVFEKL